MPNQSTFDLQNPSISLQKTSTFLKHIPHLPHARSENHHSNLDLIQEPIEALCNSSKTLAPATAQTQTLHKSITRRDGRRKERKRTTPWLHDRFRPSRPTVQQAR